MSRKTGSERRESTVLRDEQVLSLYDSIAEDLGELLPVVSRSYIYDRIQKETGLCHKTIAFILNHTKKVPGAVANYL